VKRLLATTSLAALLGTLSTAGTADADAPAALVAAAEKEGQLPVVACRLAGAAVAR
jgi:hypothetical protein